MSLSCFGEGDGAARFEMSTPQATVSVVLPHDTALKTAASILYEECQS